MDQNLVVDELGSEGFVPLAPARRTFVVKAVSDGLRMGFSTQFFAGAPDLMKGLGLAWFGLRRMWMLPVSAMPDFIAALPRCADEHPTWDFNDVREKAVAAYRDPQFDFFVSLLDIQLLPLESGGFACTSVFDPLYLRVMRAMDGIFHKFAGAWEVKAPKQVILDRLLNEAGIDPAFVFVHEAFVHLEKLTSKGKSDAPISVAGALPLRGMGNASADPTKTGTGFITTFGTPLERFEVDEDQLNAYGVQCGLRPYQLEGMKFLVTRSSALLADDMGLGKSRQGLVASRFVSMDKIILVVCPASLCINWEREIHAVFPDDVVSIIGDSTMAECRAGKWVIANYERLAGLVRDPSIKLGCLLIDEAQYLKEYQAGRTRNAFLLAERIPYVYLLSGTPILNREVEIHTLLRLSGHPIGRMELSEFRKAYAGSSEARAQLAARLPEWMLRRGKDVLKDLGVKTEQVIYIEPAGGLSGYNKILKDPNLQQMPKITKLREHLEMLKLDFIVESIQNLPAGEKALVFCEFTDSVDLLMRAFKEVGIGAVSLTGSDSPKKRMKAIDALQTDDNTTVFIGTRAAGVGYTLTRANYVYMATLPWTNALKRQAEDRAYRSGNTRDVLVVIPLVAQTIDEQVVKLLSSKGEIELDLVEANRVAVKA